MANYIGGDVEEITCSHPTLGSFRFQTKSGEDFTMDPGGIQNNDDDEGVTAAGALISKKNRKRWMVEGNIVVDVTGTNEVVGLTALANHPLPGIWTWTLISGAVYKGTGEIVGERKFSSDTTLQKLKVSGGGKLEKL